MMEVACPVAFFAVWFGIAGFVAFRFFTLGVRGVGLGAKVLDVHGSFRTKSSNRVKTDVSVVRTARDHAPIGLALVQRAPLRISGAGANLTPDQALVVAQWLRAAAGGA